MSWFMSLLMLVLFVASVGVLVSLPAVYQTPILYVIPAVIFIGFLVTLEIE
jgi:hypothetical protein